MKRLLFLISIVIATIGFGQNTGLYGKRNFVEVNTTSFYPLIQNIFYSEGAYKRAGSGLVKGKDRFNYGFHLVTGHAFKNSIGASLELGIDYGNTNGPEYVYAEIEYDYGYKSSDYVSIKHEMVDTRTILILPKIEFSNVDGNLPVGLNHQIGFGFTRTSIINQDYLYKIQAYSNVKSYAVLKDPLNTDKIYNGYTLLYALNIRTPVSKTVMINYGIRYTLNINANQSLTYFNSTNYYAESSFGRNLGKSRLSNFLTLNIGLTYAF